MEIKYRSSPHEMSLWFLSISLGGNFVNHMTSPFFLLFRVSHVSTLLFSISRQHQKTIVGRSSYIFLQLLPVCHHQLAVETAADSFLFRRQGMETKLKLFSLSRGNLTSSSLLHRSPAHTVDCLHW